METNEREVLIARHAAVVRHLRAARAEMLAVATADDPAPGVVSRNDAVIVEMLADGVERVRQRLIVGAYDALQAGESLKG